MADRLLTLEQACVAANVKPATIRAWVRAGVLRRHGHPRHPLFDVVELGAAQVAPKRRRHRGGNRPRSSGTVRRRS